MNHFSNNLSEVLSSSWLLSLCQTDFIFATPIGASAHPVLIINQWLYVKKFRSIIYNILFIDRRIDDLLQPVYQIWFA